MKCETVIDPGVDERVVIYAKERNECVEAIERFVLGEREAETVGYRGSSIVPLDTDEVSAFISEGGAVYAVVCGERLLVRERLYALEERLGMRYVRVNQSCIANVAKIARFDASLAGSLAVIFKDGYRDYVSRRQLKTVKERIGFK